MMSLEMLLSMPCRFFGGSGKMKNRTVFGIVMIMIAAAMISPLIVYADQDQGNDQEITDPIATIKIEIDDVMDQIREASMRGEDIGPLKAQLAELFEMLENFEPEERGGETLDQGGDACMDAYIINALPFCDTGTTHNLNNDYSPPDSCVDYGQSWAEDAVYAYTPSVNQTISVSLCGSSYDTDLHIWAGCPDTGTIVGCNDDIGGGNIQSCVRGLDVVAGTKYYIVVDGYRGNDGPYLIHVIEGEGCPCDPCPPPQGDACDDPFVIPGLPFYEIGSTCSFNDDYFEACPYSEGRGAPDVVYSYTPTADVVVNIDLCLSTYDTKVYVYENACDNLLTCNDDSDVCGDNSLHSYLGLVSLTGGNTYYIVVDGYGACGTYELSISPPPTGRCCYYTESPLDFVNCVDGVSEAYCDEMEGIWSEGENCNTPCEYCGPMDIVFVIDTTGSMGGAISSVANELPQIIGTAKVASDGDLRIGLVTFGDLVSTRHNLTTDIAAVEASILALTAVGGGGYPEAHDEALREVITHDAMCTNGSEFTTDFRPLAEKIIVLVTDAKPAGCNDNYEAGVDDVNAHQRALDAFAAGIRISAVFVPTNHNGGAEAVAALQDYAATTAGSYREVASNGEGTGEAINSIVEDCGQGALQLSDEVPTLDCDGAEVYPNPVDVTITVENTGTASCMNVSVEMTGGTGPGGTGVVTSTNPVVITELTAGGDVDVVFTVQLTPGAEGGCIYMRVDLTSDDCPSAFLDNICIDVPNCCEFPYEVVDHGDLPRCNYPTLVNNPAHALSDIAWLGATITGEPAPNDTVVENPSDDGVQYLHLPWTPCEVETVLVTVTGGQQYGRYVECGGVLYLNGWKDGNEDGDFCDTLCDGAAPEWIVQNMVVTPTAVAPYMITVLDPGYMEGQGRYPGIFRWRLTHTRMTAEGFGDIDRVECPNMTCGDYAFDMLGEVEDYWKEDAQLFVELASFSAVAANGRVELAWTTASEVDNDHFEIVRDGSMVGFVQSRGNAAATQEYVWVDENVDNGTTYSYTLISVDINGVREELATETATPSHSAGPVTEYALHQNYPNPFNPETNIGFDLMESDFVTLKIYNVVGQEVAVLINRSMEAGRHNVTFSAADLPTGLYLYRIEAGEFTAQKKMILMK